MHHVGANQWRERVKLLCDAAIISPRGRAPSHRGNYRLAGTLKFHHRLRENQQRLAGQAIGEASTRAGASRGRQESGSSGVRRIIWEFIYGVFPVSGYTAAIASNWARRISHLVSMRAGPAAEVLAYHNRQGQFHALLGSCCRHGMRCRNIFQAPGGYPGVILLERLDACWHRIRREGPVSEEATATGQGLVAREGNGGIDGETHAGDEVALIENFLAGKAAGFAERSQASMPPSPSRRPS